MAGLPPRDWPVGMSIVHFINWWLVQEVPAHYEQCYLLADGTGLYKKASRTRHEEQGVHNVFLHGFCFISDSGWVITLPEYNNECRNATV